MSKGIITVFSAADRAGRSEDAREEAASEGAFREIFHHELQHSQYLIRTLYPQVETLIINNAQHATNYELGRILALALASGRSQMLDIPDKGLVTVTIPNITLSCRLGDK